MIEVILPWPPTVNTYYRAHMGRQIMSKAGRAYKKKAVDILFSKFRKPLLDGKLSVTFFFQAPDRRLRDISNHVKAVEDALVSAGTIVDDSLIEQEGLYRIVPPQKPGRVRVIIEELPEDYGMDWMWDE